MVRPAIPAMMVALAMTLSSGCSETPSAAAPPPPKVTVAHPEQRELVDYDQYNGWTEASDTVEVRSRVRGHIHKVHFTDGQFVKKGDLLFELDPRPYEAEIGRARDQLLVDEAQLKFTAAEAARYEALFEKNVATQSDVEEYRAKRDSWAAKVEASKQEIKRRQLDLEYASIVAEISGRVGRARLTAGNLVNAGGSDPLLTTIVASDPIFVYFSVDERSLLKYRQLRTAEQNSRSASPESTGASSDSTGGTGENKDEAATVDTSETANPETANPEADDTAGGASEPGDAATAEAATDDSPARKSPPRHPVRDLKIPMEFGLESESGYPHRGVIDFVNNRIDPETGTIEVRGSSENTRSLFVVGSRVRVQVPVSEPYQAILIPDDAILSDQDRRYVLVLNDENVVVRREVTLGRLLPDGKRVILPATEGSEGISTSDWVVVLGLQRARINYPVEPVDTNGKPMTRGAKQPQ